MFDTFDCFPPLFNGVHWLFLLYIWVFLWFSLIFQWYSSVLSGFLEFQWFSLVPPFFIGVFILSFGKRRFFHVLIDFIDFSLVFIGFSMALDNVRPVFLLEEFIVVCLRLLLLFFLIDTILVSKASFVANVAPLFPVVVCDAAATVLVNVAAVLFSFFVYNLFCIFFLSSPDLPILQSLIPVISN